MVKASAIPMNKPMPKQGFFFKAGEEIRTPEMHVGNVNHTAYARKTTTNQDLPYATKRSTNDDVLERG